MIFIQNIFNILIEGHSTMLKYDLCFDYKYLVNE